MRLGLRLNDSKNNSVPDYNFIAITHYRKSFQKILVGIIIEIGTRYVPYTNLYFDQNVSESITAYMYILL